MDGLIVPIVFGSLVLVVAIIGSFFISRGKKIVGIGLSTILIMSAIWVTYRILYV